MDFIRHVFEHRDAVCGGTFLLGASFHFLWDIGMYYVVYRVGRSRGERRHRPCSHGAAGLYRTLNVFAIALRARYRYTGRRTDQIATTTTE